MTQIISPIPLIPLLLQIALFFQQTHKLISLTTQQLVLLLLDSLLVSSVQILSIVTMEKLYLPMHKILSAPFSQIIPTLSISHQESSCPIPLSKNNYSPFIHLSLTPHLPSHRTLLLNFKLSILHLIALFLHGQIPKPT